MSSLSALHEHVDFLYNIGTSTKSQFQHLLSSASDEQVTLLVECIANVHQFLPELPKRQVQQAESIVYTFLKSNDRRQLMQHWKYIRSIVARILTIVYKTEIWRVLLHHG